MNENTSGGRGPFAPTFDGKGASFLDFEQRVALWSRTTDIPEDRRASQLVLHMEPFARQVCLQNGGDSFMEGVAVTEVLQVLKQYFLPDASDHVYQDVWKFLHHKRTDQTMERFLLEFDLLRAKAERKIQVGFRFPDSFISVLCMGNGSLSAHQKTLVMASVQGSLDSYPALAKQMRQILQPVGSAQKEDVLMHSPTIMADNVGIDEEDLSYEAWVAYRKAGKGRMNSQQYARSKSKGKGSKPHDQERNGLNRRTGERNRCYGCGSEFHLLPKCPRRPDFVKTDSPAQSIPNTAPRSSFSSIAMDPVPPPNDEPTPAA